jgi:predicted patatin/cPLA2 family phospholipase
VAANVVPSPRKLRALAEKGAGKLASVRGGGSATATADAPTATTTATPPSPSPSPPSSPRSPRRPRSASPDPTPPRAAAPPLVPRPAAALMARVRRRRAGAGGGGEPGDAPRARVPPPPPPVNTSHPVLALLRDRAASGSQPGARTDGARLALVVEGGGMRGAVSAGGLQALHDAGLARCFDAVYGSSAGAINATYFLSGQRDGVDVYARHIANERFCDLRRLVKRRGASTASTASADELSGGASSSSSSTSSSDSDGAAGVASTMTASDPRTSEPALPPPALDLNFLLKEVMDPGGAHPLDWDAVVHSPVPLKVVASCVDTLQPVVLENFTDAADLAACLRASANVPEVAGGPVQHRGRRLVDAAVFEPVPFRAAINDGATHVLTLCTRGPPAGRVARLVDGVVSRVVKRAVMSPPYMKPVWRREVEYLAAFGLNDFEMLQLALDHVAAASRPEFGGAALYPVFPGPAAQYSPVCLDVDTILGGIAEGRGCVERILGELFQGEEGLEGEGAGASAVEEGAAGASSPAAAA